MSLGFLLLLTESLSFPSYSNYCFADTGGYSVVDLVDIVVSECGLAGSSIAAIAIQNPNCVLTVTNCQFTGNTGGCIAANLQSAFLWAFIGSNCSAPYPFLEIYLQDPDIGQFHLNHSLHFAGIYPSGGPSRISGPPGAETITHQDDVLLFAVNLTANTATSPYPSTLVSGLSFYLHPGLSLDFCTFSRNSPSTALVLTQLSVTICKCTAFLDNIVTNSLQTDHPGLIYVHAGDIHLFHCIFANPDMDILIGSVEYKGKSSSAHFSNCVFLLAGGTSATRVSIAFSSCTSVKDSPTLNSISCPLQIAQSPATRAPTPAATVALRPLRIGFVAGTGDANFGVVGYRDSTTVLFTPSGIGFRTFIVVGSDAVQVLNCQTVNRPDWSFETILDEESAELQFRFANRGLPQTVKVVIAGQCAVSEDWTPLVAIDEGLLFRVTSGSLQYGWRDEFAEDVARSVWIGPPVEDLGLVNEPTLPRVSWTNTEVLREVSVHVELSFAIEANTITNLSIPITGNFDLPVPEPAQLAEVPREYRPESPVVVSGVALGGQELVFGVFVEPNVSQALRVIAPGDAFDATLTLPDWMEGTEVTVRFWYYDPAWGTIAVDPLVYRIAYPFAETPAATGLPVVDPPPTQSPLGVVEPPPTQTPLPEEATPPTPPGVSEVETPPPTVGDHTPQFAVPHARVRKVFANYFLVPILMPM
jgi:hypothetical protein